MSFAPISSLQLRAALLVLLGMIAVVSTANLFEHVGGFIPCKLCLEQRLPYYAAIPLAALAAFAAWQNWKIAPCLVRGLLMICGLAMLMTLAQGIQQSGMEWGFWAGPADCSASVTQMQANVPSVAGDLLTQMAAKKPPACDEAAGRFLGLSFAGWNVVAAFVLAMIAFYGAFKQDTE